MKTNEVKNIALNYFVNKNIKESLLHSSILKPNVNYLNLFLENNSIRNKVKQLYIYDKNELRIEVLNEKNIETNIINKIKLKYDIVTKPIIAKSKDKFIEYKLIWPPITQERIKKNESYIKLQQEKEIDLLRDKRKKCRQELHKSKTKEEIKIIDKIIDDIFIKEKTQIISLYKETLKNI